MRRVSSRQRTARRSVAEKDAQRIVRPVPLWPSPYRAGRIRPVLGGGAAGRGGREPEAVRGALGEELPEHLVLSRVVFPDSVPRAVAGRADRAALVRLSREAGTRHPSPR
ncbi:predicted protein [Streptomyces viridosporus ATCC 14672]|uniref:Predicted protein n=1 Tax=Streptomyces viridosporus (strain ATCC 14672 / DSM 40746 / JCM 4963 / KCTC 9882 / NRRL B-12104 / FH 1290) TaxID=566461 RepID=D6A024_STRV1|nr:predicted protein [Streptomyces viridosporus ATCC 14672]